MNSELAKIFRELAFLLEMKGVDFKPRAFEKAAASIEESSEDLARLYREGGPAALRTVPGIGAGIAERIEEYIKTGKIAEYEKLKHQLPVNVKDLSSIEGLGPKTILKLYKKLHVTDRAALEAAIRSGKFRRKGFGEKTEQNILKNIEFLKQSAGRLPLGAALPIARGIIETLRRVSGVAHADVAGSLRRRQETIGDIDLLAASADPEKVMEFFTTMPQVAGVHEKGPTRSSVRLNIGLDADLRVVPPEAFGAALQYFTGDKSHNIAVRQIAIKQGYKLNEYGLFKGEKLIAGKTEQEIYAALGMDCPDPEIRTDEGEVEAALKHELPELVGYKDIKGDLQVHTEWSDGRYSIKEMAAAAREFGHEYICISDHTHSLAITGGMDENRLLEQMAEIDRVQKELPDIKILKGAEVNILKDGTLDLADEVLARLDVCGAAVHSHFNLSEKEMTARIVRAIENPNVDILYHPTGRIIEKRAAYKVDIGAVIAAARRTKTVLEIDGWPERLDLKDEHVRRAVTAGVKICIDTDSHSFEHFSYIEYGISQARRGWATKKDVINTRSWHELLKLLK